MQVFPFLFNQAFLFSAVFSQWAPLKKNPNNLERLNPEVMHQLLCKIGFIFSEIPLFFCLKLFKFFFLTLYANITISVCVQHLFFPMVFRPEVVFACIQTLTLGRGRSCEVAHKTELL